MSDRFYKIGNTWYPWQTAHGLYGYTKTPTIRITYISTSQATWGQPESGYGFFDGDASEPQNGSYFHTSTWGWFDADTMAKTVWLMPSECEIDDIFFENDGDISPGARLIIDPNVSIDEEDWRYLIASVRNLGWHTLDEWEALGWVLSDPNTLYFGGDFSGNNIRMESVDGGGGLIDKYASYKTLFELRGWEPGGLFIDKPRMMGICGVITETSDSVVQVEVPKLLSVGRIEFTGSLAEGGIPESGVVEEYNSNVLEMDFGYYSYNGTSFEPVTLHANDYGVAGILTQQDSDRLENFGLSVSTTISGRGPIGCVSVIESLYYSFTQELLGIYENIVNNRGANPVTYDPSNFRLEVESNNILYIKNTDAFATPVSAWRCRFTRIEHEIEYIEILLGLRWRSDHWGSESFDYPSSNYWYGGIMSQEDQQRLIDFGCTITDENSSTKGTYGTISYDSNFVYEAIDMYSDVQGTVSNGFDMSNFEIRDTNGFSIWCTSSYSTLSMTWRCRVVKRVQPAPVLPTVSTKNDFGNYNWLDILYPPPRNISPGISNSLPLDYHNQSVLYDQDKSYGIIVWQASPGTNSGRTEFAILNYNRSIYAINVSQSSQTIYSARVAVCSSNETEIVTVYDNQNAPFNAFKYNDGTADYYYVLDDIQTDWTDDLSSIGYHLPPV